MFRGTTFNICTVDACMQIMGVPPNEDYKGLRLYHCINWGDMPVGTPQQIMDRTLKMLLGGYMDIEKLSILFGSYEHLKLECLQKDLGMEELKQQSMAMEAKLRADLKHEKEIANLLVERLKVHEAKRGVFAKLLG